MRLRPAHPTQTRLAAANLSNNSRMAKDLILLGEVAARGATMLEVRC
jgi:hypothetical protein